MSDGFQPKSAFEGYVVAKLEAMTQRLDILPCNEVFKRLGKCEQDIANIKGKATVWGIVAGIFSGVASKFIPGK